MDYLLGTATDHEAVPGLATVIVVGARNAELPRICYCNCQDYRESSRDIRNSDSVRP